MTKKLEYVEILDRLPELNLSEEFMKGFKSEKEFKLSEEQNTLFIEPTFSINDDFVNDLDPQVILISASGAVGKSTLAKQIAFEKHVPIFNLADCETVGKKSFSGIIVDSFDDYYQDMLINFRNGKHFFIIDALDEGRMKTNEEGFSAFLADIAKHAKRTSGVSFILLGRNQVIETVWVELNDLKVKTLTLSIDPFNENHAMDYIDKKVNREIGSSNLIEQHKNHYTEARNLIYDQLKHAVHLNDKDKESEDSKFFLGYAPVLDAISTLLSKEKNFIKLKESFSGDSLATSRSVLIHIVEYILIREQEEKFLSNFKQKSEQISTRLNWNSWNTLYSTDEQAKLLLSKDLDRNELSIPDEIASMYEESIDTWLPEHPFMNGKGFANIVFESYILAKNLTSDSVNTRELAEDYIRNSGFRDFPLLADFYYYFTTQKEQCAVPEHIGIIYDSLISFMPNQCTLEMLIDGPDVDEMEENDEIYNEVECTLTLFKKSEESLIPLMEYGFKLVYHQDSKLIFRKGIRNSQINVPFDVELGYLGIREYSFTANLFVNCRKLYLYAKSIVVQKNVKLQEETDNEQQYVLLKARNYEGLVEEKPKCFTNFDVNWEGSNRYPWSDYSKSMEQDTGIDKDIFRRFKRIALSFRSHSKGEMARFIDKIEHRRLLKGELGEKILEKMLEDGILIKRLSDNMYVWQSLKADELLGVSWTSLRNDNVSDKLRVYLNQFHSQP
jgi:hypothetical protein